MRHLFSAVFLAVTVSSAFAAPPSAVAPSSAVAPTSVTTPDQVVAAFNDTVKLKTDVPADVALSYLNLALERLAAENADLSYDQFLTVVDRNKHVQTMLVYLVGAGGAAHRFVGASPVSTGGTTKFDHYLTPELVYEHTLTDFSDFRAEGSKNKNGIRGYGARGMRVWDFGWFAADKTWATKNKAQTDIRFQMHATDAGLLERRLGVPDSKGCVRLSGSLNTFLDKYGALDWHYEQAADEGRRPWVWRKDRVDTPFAGRYMVVLDSEEAAAPAWKK